MVDAPYHWCHENQVGGSMPLPLVTTLPCLVPLLFGWLLHFPVPQPLPLVASPLGASASAIHYASTFPCAPLVWLVVALPSASTPILSQLRLVPRPPPLVDPLLVTAFSIVCRLSRRRIPSIRHHLPQSKRPPNIAVSIVVVVRVRCQRRASFAVAVAGGTLARIVTSVGSPPPFPAVRARRQGVAPRREQVQVVDDVCVPGTPLELGQKASFVSQL